MRNDFLQHHGILGQKWGVRRYQNPDGSLTNAGRRHLYKDVKKTSKHNTTREETVASIKDTVNSKLTNEQKAILAKKYEKMSDDQKKDVENYTKTYNEEYNKRFKNKKPTNAELEQLTEDVTDMTLDSPTAQKAYKSWDEYISYKTKTVNDLVGKYGSKELNSMPFKTYSALVGAALEESSREMVKANRERRIT